MKIGQPFYKINSNHIPSTFNDHKFSVLFILGIQQNAELNVVLECTSADLTIVEALTEDRARNGYYVTLDYNADAFSKLSDNDQNDVLFTQFGYVANPENLRTEFNSAVEDRILIERDHIDQWSDRLDEIQDSIDNPTSTFEAGYANVGNIYVGDTVELFAKLSSVSVTDDTTFYINSSAIGPVGTNLYVPTVAGTYTASCVYEYHSLYFTFSVLPTP